MSQSQTTTESAFLTRFKGPFKGVLRWPQLDQLWETIVAHPDKHWYVYAVGETPPTTITEHDKLTGFLTQLRELLQKEHEEDYCGVVYTDDFKDPQYIKIFDPNNLGVSCGSSDNPPLPGWVLSLLPPADLPEAFPPPGNRRRWWQKVFS